MATAIQQRPANGQQAATKAEGIDLSKALEAVLEATPSQRFKAIDGALRDRIEQIEELLPRQMKGQGARLAKRAVLTLNRRPKDYEDVTAQSFIRCVLEAAENGFAIDGKYAYAIVYNNKIKGQNGERDKWVKEAQMQLSYMALVAVSRRLGILKDAYARIVRANDSFQISESNGRSNLDYSPALSKPGDVIGAYAVAILPDGSCRWEWMDIEDIHKIRARSKSWQNDNGPWLTDPGEMQKKTVLRRLLKMYGDDPAMQMALDMDDGDYDDSIPEPPKRPSALARFTEPEPVAEAAGEPAVPPPTEPTPVQPTKAEEPILGDMEIQDLWNDLHTASNPLEMEGAVEAVQRNRTKMKRSDLSRLETKISEMKKTIK